MKFDWYLDDDPDHKGKFLIRESAPDGVILASNLGRLDSARLLIRHNIALEAIKDNVLKSVDLLRFMPGSIDPTRVFLTMGVLENLKKLFKDE